MSNCTRRAFLGLAASAAVCVGIGGTAKAFGSNGDLLRPPGAQDATSFLATCVRCNRCLSACPQGCIAVGTVSDSLLDARTPVLQMHQGYCDFCDVCRQVCPTGAIGEFDPERDKIGVAVVQSDRCLAYSGGCTKCYQECPYGAISLNSAQCPVVDPELCNGCGICENICPALVYRSFAGGKRRGIKVVAASRYEALGATTVNGEEVGLDG